MVGQGVIVVGSSSITDHQIVGLGQWTPRRALVRDWTGLDQGLVFSPGSVVQSIVGHRTESQRIAILHIDGNSGVVGC